MCHALTHAEERESAPQPQEAARIAAAADNPPPPDQARGYAKPPGTEPEDVGLFVPRLVLAVPRYVLKFVFHPVIGAVVLLDRHAVIERVKDVLYNDERTAGIVPTLSVDTFFGPTFGVRAFHEDLGGREEHASVEARFGGRYEQAYQVEFRADRVAGSRLWLESLTRFEVEPALLFHGIGHPVERATGVDLAPDEAAVETRFRQQRLLALARLGYTMGEPRSITQIGVTGIFNNRSFEAPTRGRGLATEEVYDTTALVGYEEGAATLEADATLIIDTRNAAGATSSGVYFELFAGGVPPIGEYQFWHHGFEATAYVDLYLETRVLVVRATLEGVEGESHRIPFSELPRLGGPYRLRGYPADRFRDEKAALGTLEYHYPIHQYVAGSLHAELGRVAPSYSDLFGSDVWRLGVGGGFVVRSQDSLLFTVDVAYGDALQVYLTTDPLRAFATRDTEL